jgi:nucleotide-binding universal stress UspA family protein
MTRTYKRLYVPVDNSGHSFAAIDLVVDLASRLQARVQGSHVFEPGADAPCLGLLEESCRAAHIPFEPRRVEGSQHRMILDDIRDSQCDLVVIGALGEGAVDTSQIGSVAERVARRSAADVLVVRNLVPDDDAPILAAVDGSDPSLRALNAALTLGAATSRSVSAVVVGDCALAGRPSRALDAARAAARLHDQEVSFVVTEGKPFDRLLKQCAERRPWLLVLGRTGAGADEAEDDMGSTAANLLRLAPCNVLMTSGAVIARKDESHANRRAAAPPPAPALRSLRWMPDAEALLEDVPTEQRGTMIRAVEDGARRMGIKVITADAIDRVMLGPMQS